MITRKAARCQRWAWAYISRYPGLSTRQIQGATVDYFEDDVGRALVELVRLGYVAQDSQRLWQPVIRFILQAPAWW